MARDPVATAAAVADAAREGGEATAQALFGQLLLDVNGIERDAVEALSWFRLAAHAGNAMAVNMVGRCHELGWGTPADHELAIVWYRNAAESGLVWGVPLGQPAGDGARNGARSCARIGAESASGGPRPCQVDEPGRPTPRGGLGSRARSHCGACVVPRIGACRRLPRQASYAAVLAPSGRVDEAVEWLQRALQTGSPAFLSRVGDELAASSHAALRAIGLRMHEPRNARHSLSGGY